MQKRDLKLFKYENERGQALIQSMMAMGVVMLILAGAAPLGNSVAKQQAQANFNNAIQSLSDSFIAVTTNPNLCSPSSGGGNSWVLPMGNNSPNWSSVFKTTFGNYPLQPVNVMITLPFKDSSGKQILLYGQDPTTGGLWPNGQTPNTPSGLGAVTHTYQWSYLNGVDPLTITSLRFVPNPQLTNPLAVLSGNAGYTIEGTLQYTATSPNNGVIASSWQTVANMKIMMTHTGMPTGCEVMQSPQQTCELYGGMWNPNLSPQCRFGFTLNCNGSTNGSCKCPAGQYISKFNGDGTATCSLIKAVCPPVNPALPENDQTNPFQAFAEIIGGAVGCAAIDYPNVSTIQFNVSNETVAQGSGNPNIELDLTPAQPSQTVTVDVTISGGTPNIDYTEPASAVNNKFTVTFPPGVTQEYIGQGFSVLNSGSANPVAVTFALSNPQPLQYAALGTPGANTLMISPAPASCTGTTLSWSGTGGTCSGPVSTRASGSSATATSTTGGTGTATFTCNNGSWGPPTGATCTAGVSTPMHLIVTSYCGGTGVNSSFQIARLTIGTLPSVGTSDTQCSSPYTWQAVGSSAVQCSYGCPVVYSLSGQCKMLNNCAPNSINCQCGTPMVGGFSATPYPPASVGIAYIPLSAVGGSCPGTSFTVCGQ